MPAPHLDAGHGGHDGHASHAGHGSYDGHAGHGDHGGHAGHDGMVPHLIADPQGGAWSPPLVNIDDHDIPRMKLFI